MKLGIAHIFSIIAAFQSLFIAVILINKKNRNQSNWILSSLFFFFAILLIDTMAFSREIFPQIQNFHKLIILFSNTPLVVAPIIFLYVRSVLQADYKLSYKAFYHFIPAVLATLFFSYYWFPQPKYSVLDSTVLYKIIEFFILAQNLIYLVLIIVKLLAHKLKSSPAKKKSKLPRIKLAIYLSIAFIFLWMIDLACLILYDIFKDADYCSYSNSSLYSLGFILCSLILYWAVLFPESVIKKNKYQASQIKDKQRKDYKKKIVDYLQKEKAYLNPKLNLNKLAEQLEMSPTDLSQTLNQELNKSFIEFINDFRIEEFKTRLNNPEKENFKYFADIYYSVGFNSKSAFYNAFKKSTGMTPKEYQQRIKK